MVEGEQNDCTLHYSIAFSTWIGNSKILSTISVEDNNLWTGGGERKDNSFSNKWKTHFSRQSLKYMSERQIGLQGFDLREGEGKIIIILLLILSITNLGCRAQSDYDLL